MSEQLFAFRESTPANLEFVGFEDGLPPAGECEQAGPPKKAARHTRAKKPRKRPHVVRVTFDDREFLRLAGRAGAKGVSIDDYVKAQALRDPRLRTRQGGSSGRDLFASPPPPAATAPAIVDLPAALGERIDAYFVAEPRFSAGLPVPVRKIGRLRPQTPRLAKLGHFLADLVAARWHRAAPRGGT